jgi:hypothetical protein
MSDQGDDRNQFPDFLFGFTCGAVFVILMLCAGVALMKSVS